MIEALRLGDFRNYAALIFRPQAPITVLTGSNGSGKTNLLEAISLLGPGRGLRGARIAELARRDGAGGWAIAAELRQHGGGTIELGTGIEPGDPSTRERRRFLLNGEAPRSTAELAGLAPAVWLTPQMDGLFTESTSGRRRFLDRLVWSLEPSHAREAAAHDTAMAERNRLLASRGADPAWLAGLEASMARHGVALAAARASLVRRLNDVALPASAFPRVRLILHDTVAERLDTDPALAAERWLAAELGRRRGADAAASGATLGAHRADMGLADARTSLAAAQASTGEQRALLTSLVLAHAALIAEARGTAPMLLLDEAAVHLDPMRRAALFLQLAETGGQVFLTGTEPQIFEALRGTASFHRVETGRMVDE